MSLIAQLKAARRENEALKEQLREMESDVILFSTKFSEFWQLLGLDFSKKDSEDEQKGFSTMEIVKALAKVGKDFTFGKLKKQDITDKWDAVSPLFAKYDHLISKKDV